MTFDVRDKISCAEGVHYGVFSLAPRRGGQACPFGRLVRAFACRDQMMAGDRGCICMAARRRRTNQTRAVKHQMWRKVMEMSKISAAVEVVVRRAAGQQSDSTTEASLEVITLKTPDKERWRIRLAGSGGLRWPRSSPSHYAKGFRPRIPLVTTPS